VKRLLFLFTLLILFTSCSNLLLLRYNFKKYHAKQCNYIRNDTIFRLEQIVFYNKPNVIDSWFARGLFFTFLNTNAAKTKKILDLETDTLIVKTEYSGWSVWDWSENESNKIKGTIELLQWDADKIILREKIFVTDYKRKQKKKYIGEKAFLYEWKPEKIKKTYKP